MTDELASQREGADAAQRSARGWRLPIRRRASRPDRASGAGAGGTFTRLRKQATGVLVEERRIVCCTVTGTSARAKNLESWHLPIVDGNVREAFERLAADERVRGTIAVGLDLQRDFFVTRELRPGEEEQSAVALLGSSLGRVSGGVVAARMPARLPGSPKVTLTACPKKLATQIYEGVADSKTDRTALLAVAPLVCSLAMRWQRAPRRWRTQVRILAGDHRGLAVLAHGRSPVASRLFEWSDDSTIHSVKTAVLGLWAHARSKLGIDEVDGVLLHLGRQRASLAERIQESCGVETRIAVEIPLDAEHTAFAIAVGALRRGTGCVDLFSDLRSPPGFRENFPLAAAIFLGSAVAAVAALLHVEAASLESSERMLRKQIAADCTVAGIDEKRLPKRFESLRKEVEFAEHFIVDRVLWAPLMRELPDLVPSTMRMTDFDGRAVLQGFSTRQALKGSKRVFLSGEAPFAGEDSSPPEVPILTNRILASETFVEHFPEITGANVRLKPGVDGDLARILLICAPEGGGK